ncbi:MAG: hypothetical protein ACFFAS_13450 [Promethearchaeota archaeon]
MEKKYIDKISSIIEQVEKKEEDLGKFLESLSISSRSDHLIDIIVDAISKNDFFKELDISIDKIIKNTKQEKSPIFTVIANTIANIRTNPNKKVIYLKEFLSFFHEIAESDKEVLLKSLKDENIELLREKLISLVELFNLKV